MPYATPEKRRAAARAKSAAARAGRPCALCGGEIPTHFQRSRVICDREECERERRRRYTETYRRARGMLPRDQSEAQGRYSAAQRARWAEGITFKPRLCRYCAQEFAPASPPQRYCSFQCKMDYRARLTKVEFDEMYARQGGRCALCGVDGKKGWMRKGERRKGWLVVDHCHDTGQVRGLLCGDCNTALGRFGDDPERLRAAAAYLEALQQ